jgi:hypothetical protein
MSIQQFSITAISFHYGDRYWIDQLIQGLNLQQNESIKKIIIVDNSIEQDFFPRESNIPVEIKRFTNPFLANKQHAYSINFILQNTIFETERILLLDSDIVFIDSSFFSNHLNDLSSYDAVLALQEGSRCLSHPCFNLIKTSFIKNIDFSQGMHEMNFDTGRLVGLQLSQVSNNILTLHPSKWFKNSFGYSYLENSFVHITSASVRQLPKRKSAKFKAFKFSYLKWISRRHNKIVRSLPIIFLLPIAVVQIALNFGTYRNIRKTKNEFTSNNSN